MSGNKHHAGLLRGKKFSARHQTLIPPAMSLIREIRGYPEINKIVIGKIMQAGHGNQQHLSIAEVPAGLRLRVRGTASIQELWAYTSERDRAKQLIEAAWGKVV